ncbi:unnamed protein product, partial [Ectocarpus fasciculatus]
RVFFFCSSFVCGNPKCCRPRARNDEPSIRSYIFLDRNCCGFRAGGGALLSVGRRVSFLRVHVH